MRRSRHNLKRSPSASHSGFAIALALFVILCGSLLMLVSWRDDDGDTTPESAVEQRVRSAASQVSAIASDSQAAGKEVEAARLALESMDYGRSRRHMQKAEEVIDDLAGRLNAVESKLRNRNAPKPGKAEAEPGPGR